MNAIRVLLFAAAFSLVARTMGQCSIGVTAFSFSVFCVNTGSNTYAPEMGGNASWQGGTPPYTLHASCPGTYAYDFTGITTTSHGIDMFVVLNGPAPIVLTQPVSITVVDALGCISNIASTTSATGPWSTHPYTFDDAVNSFTPQLALTDSVAGLFTLTLLDDPSDGGTPFANPAWSNFTTYRNGSSLGTVGFNAPYYLTGPDRLVRTSLQPGNYVVNYSLGSQGTYAYCSPSSGTLSMIIPNANDHHTNVVLHASLQGALPGGTVMTDALRSANLIPTTEPYSSLGYTYTGSSPGATIAASMLTVTGNDAIEDWVVVELRNSTTPSQVVYSKAALIQRDGDVIDTDGDGYVAFPVPAGNYYVALRHRNHLGLMTGAAQALGLMPIDIDFRSASTACYGTTPRAQVGSVYCLWSGDATGDGTVKYTGNGNDRDPILTAIGGTVPTNALSNFYDRRDVNLDGVIKYTGANNDRDPILVNIGGVVPTNTRTQQLP